MDFNKAVDKVLENVNSSISWSSMYNQLCDLLGNDFDSYTSFYDYIDEMMLDRGFRMDKKTVPTYYRKDYKPKTKRVNKNQEKLF